MKKRTVRGVKYVMKTFFEKCIERYQRLAPGFELEHADTPFIDEEKGVVNHRGRRK